jgi:uncharacterized protein
VTRRRAVIDTNVFIAALIKPSGTAAKAVARAISEFTVIYSADTISELEGKLATAKLQKYVPSEEATVFLDALRRDAVLVDVSASVRASRDPKDDKFIALAAAGGADFLVTGDKDLLVIGVYKDTRIVTPSQFLALGAASS